MAGRLVLFVAALAAVVGLVGCGNNGEGREVHRGLLRMTSIPKKAPEGGKLRPAHPKSVDGSPGRGFLR